MNSLTKTYKKLSTSIYYKTGHAVSFSSTQRMEPTELPAHVKGAWQVTLSRWPDQGKLSMAFTPWVDVKTNALSEKIAIPCDAEHVTHHAMC